MPMTLGTGDALIFESPIFDTTIGDTPILDTPIGETLIHGAWNRGSGQTGPAVTEQFDYRDYGVRRGF